MHVILINSRPKIELAKHTQDNLSEKVESPIHWDPFDCKIQSMKTRHCKVEN